MTELSASLAASKRKLTLRIIAEQARNIAKRPGAVATKEELDAISVLLAELIADTD